MKRISLNYVTTLDPTSSEDMARLKEIRSAISFSNKYSILKNRVRVCGRKPTTGYDWGGNVIGGIRNATRLDVYIYNV